ncbi:ribosomal protein S12 methylthiotransferase [Terriglobus roseus]|uniref:Ribosomal protein uS12 methylthiotransferase RimO n=1 Tax=Terriglobus roseus TaxID=392734 RepID=A0A1G7EX99_9BACT|nr:30S ribosomal protein S12 methylthiotransferase RimO [Terriglobus roseus]SDE68271.1 ribosomal protein S12 methylthiotransferase [Terriglobus roseus]
MPTITEAEIKTNLSTDTIERPKIGFVSLGCPKNLVDSEVMMGMVHHAGAQLTPAAEDADIIVVNTCSFIDSAKQESVNTILEMVQHKTEGRAKRLIVTGCLVERYRDEIQKNIPEVDAVLGTGELDDILAAAGLHPKPVPNNSPFNILTSANAPVHTHAHTELGGAAALEVEVAEGNLSPATIAESSLIDRASSAVRKHSQLEVPEQTSRPEGDLREKQGRFARTDWDGATAELPSYLYSDETPRILSTPRASAYIKIAEGCDHPCGFCIIPQLRGKFRSRRISSILNEAENLVKQGVREITLIGQDTTCYGEDLGMKDGLAMLLEALATLEVEGIGKIHWLRFLYAYPNKVTTKLLETIAAHDNIAKYLDVPLQHASPTVLKRMKRGGSGDIFLRMLDKARSIVPDIAIRTSFIVGFPGETDEEFAELETFIKAAKIDWLGVFSYSDEEGSPAFDLGDKVPKRTIESRRRKLMRTQLKLSAKARAAQVGKVVEVLVEGPSEETELLWQARTLQQAPEIDGHVLLNDFGPHEALLPGTFYQAEITEAHDYDVVARILD